MTEKSYFCIRGNFDSETELEKMGKIILAANALEFPFRLDVFIPTGLEIKPTLRWTLPEALLKTEGVFYTDSVKSGMSYETIRRLQVRVRSHNPTPAIPRIDIAIDEEYDIEKEIQSQLNLLKKRSEECLVGHLPAITKSMTFLWDVLAKIQETSNKGD